MNNQDSAKDAVCRLIDQTVVNDGHPFCLAKLAFMSKMVDAHQVETAIKIRAALGPKNGEQCLAKIMLGKHMITPEQFKSLKKRQALFETRSLDIKFGELVVELGYATKKAVDDALKIQKELFSRKKALVLLGDIMVSSGSLSVEQHAKILQKQRRIDDISKLSAKSKPSDKPPSDAPNQDESQAESNDKAEIGFNLRISEDKLEAHVFIQGDLPSKVSPEDLIKFLSKQEINPDLIDKTRLASLFEGQAEWSKPRLIAAGKPAVDGKDAEIKYHFDINPMRIGTEKKGGTIDFKDRGETPHVQEGSILAEKIPAQEGSAGMDVLGNPIEPKAAKDIKLRVGKGAKRSEDGLQVVADIDGMPHLSLTGDICVFSKLEIKGDVDLKSGHVNFNGEIIVTGAVRSGFKVQGHSLQVTEIQRAEINTTGDIDVSGGIKGAVIKTEGNLNAVYIHEGHIVALGDVVVSKEIIDSTIETSGACLVKTGAIMSSTIDAKNGVWAYQIGSEVARPCKLIIGGDPYVRMRFKELSERITEIDAQVEQFEHTVENLKNGSKRIESNIGYLAQQQDKNTVKRRQVESALKQFEADGDQERAAKAKQMVAALDSTMAKQDKNLDALLTKQEQLLSKLTEIKKQLTPLSEERTACAEETEALNEMAESNAADAEVRVDDTVFHGTKISGNHASIVLSDDLNRVRLKEGRLTTDEEDGGWEIKIYNR